MAKKVQVTVTDKMEAKTGGIGPQSSRTITRKLCPSIEYWIQILLYYVGYSKLLDYF